MNGTVDVDFMWVCNPDRVLAATTVDIINQELYSLSKINHINVCYHYLFIFYLFYCLIIISPPYANFFIDWSFGYQENVNWKFR